MFDRQRRFMELLRDNGALASFPLDLSSKDGQETIRLFAWKTTEELAEATAILRNRAHDPLNVGSFDRSHYVEEICDALAFFMEICVLSDIPASEVYEQFVRKNAAVTEKFVARLEQASRR